MNLITNNQPLTMSSREIAELTGKRHDNVMRVIETLINKNLLESPQFEDTQNPQNKMIYREAKLGKTDTLVLIVRLSPEFTKKVVDRWQELESQQKPALPQTFAEALQLAADQAKLIEEQAPKVAFVDNLVERKNLLTATQVGQKHKMSAIKLNKILDELGVYNGAIKRSRAFKQWFIDKGYGEMKQNESGYDQPLFTNAGEVWINEQLHSEGII